jgi:hypothetical protein
MGRTKDLSMREGVRDDQLRGLKSIARLQIDR